jgi:hypothetical protein
MRLKALLFLYNACGGHPGVVGNLHAFVLATEADGALVAAALVVAVGNADEFKNGREPSAWVGRNVLLGISKRGDLYLQLKDAMDATVSLDQQAKVTADALLATFSPSTVPNSPYRHKVLLDCILAGILAALAIGAWVLLNPRTDLTFHGERERKLTGAADRNVDLDKIGAR